jgi:DNA-directed RNA polymerase specialized sigma24 family protein
MTTIEELREIRRMRLAIELDRERAARLREQIGCATSRARLGGSRGSAEPDVMSAQIARLVDMESEVLNKVVDCECRILDIERKVDELPGAQRMVMRLRYFEGYGWEKVAKTMHYTARRCLQMHEEGLEKLASC